MRTCNKCVKKINCCKCSKLLCEQNGSHKTSEENHTNVRPCSTIGHYKLGDDKACCTDCYNQGLTDTLSILSEVSFS